MLKKLIATATMAAALTIPVMRFIALPAVVYSRPEPVHADQFVDVDKMVQISPDTVVSTGNPGKNASKSEKIPVIGKDAILALIDAYASKYAVSRATMRELVDCETAGTFDPTIQSGHIWPDGTREQSFGLAQIHLPAHPEVTHAQAIDSDFALEFMAKHLAAGDRRMWSC